MTDQSIEDASRNSIIEDAKAAGLLHPKWPNEAGSKRIYLYELEKFVQLQAARQSSQSEPVAEVFEEKLADWSTPHAAVKWHQTDFPIGTKFYAAPQQAIPSGWIPTDAEVLEWNKRNDDKFQGKVHEARKAIEDARSMHLLSAAPIERDK
jgi:hypothetical protein